MEIRKANSKDYIELRELWQNVFGDSDKYIDNLYESLAATGYVLRDDEKVVSCLTVFDVGNYKGKVISEIYAVCTLPNARGKGYASKLIEFTRNEIAKAEKLAMICPADESLIAFYERLGFESYFYVSKLAQNGSSRIELNDRFKGYVISEGEIESANLIDIDDGEVVVEGMIDSSVGISKQKNEYPYFGFPMK